MTFTYNIMTGMNFQFDASNYTNGINYEKVLPWQETIFQKVAKRNQRYKGKKNFVGVTTYKKGTPVWQLHIATGKLQRAELIDIGNGNCKLTIKKGYDYFVANSKQVAENKTRKYYLKKY